MPIWALCTEWPHGTKTPCKRANNVVGLWKERIFLNDIIYLFFLPNSTACHPARCIIVLSDHFLQGFIRIEKKKLTWAIFYQIFKMSLSCLQILKKLIQWKSKQLQFLLKKVPTLNRPHSKISITHENKISSQHLLIFDAKMLRAKSFNFCCCY